MKNICLLGFLLILVFTSCRDKKEVQIPSRIPAHLSSLDAVIAGTSMSDNFDNIDLDKLPRISPVMYDSLQLAKITDLQGYESSDLSMGRILLANEDGRIITVQIITGGEITEYLVSYDEYGQLVDNMLVAYEDMVEYNSQITSVITSNNITVQTVNFMYADEQGNPVEQSDTLITKYEITPEFRFVQQM